MVVYSHQLQALIFWMAPAIGHVKVLPLGYWALLAI